ncbi:Similar to Lrsam1: E3 ubiquitin-protein ligase LRSAM1 (Mus musculus) [Cotesia congregata]|uniref:Similar to Lrsam1: E3 ubiquitin-protein ligase LRSAM1 (Mus musculus) n=1 Tax=Cotesia congregata TaxID=51543 RepID=A0A8J2MBT6_COTCN|nr:Similar to Lrsam1: E3 ubiquitin-protein ligase LRSAM1 (Mus musculus) [Cotesia congregata]
MSFRKHNNKYTVDFKARLEHKLYLARENPEPIFDISNCALKTIPSGIFSLCKVFRKKELKLNVNKLTSLSGGGQLEDLSLIKLLDISDNEFANLPSDIYHLELLEELYLQNNNLKKLPTEITELSKLKILNVSNNKLKFLPDTMGSLKNLNILDISDNPLTKLPKSLGEAQKLIELKLDNVDLIYPPLFVVQGGAIAIVAYLAQELGVNYATRDAFLDAQLEKLHNNDNERLVETKDNLQERRQNALLEVEKNIREQQEYELHLQSINKDMKKKLLEDLVEQQTRLESEIERVQQERELNRNKLLSFIYNAEQEADSVIEKFLRNSEAERLAQAQLLEMENKEQLELLSQSHLDQSLCRTRETLLSMEELLKEELLTEKKIEEYNKFRDCNAQSLLTLELRSNNHLASIVKNQKQDREEMINQLRRDEGLQKAALTALLERSDARSWSIVQQVYLIQSQLVTLTNIELERKKLEITQQINDISDKRIILSNILVGLLEQQDKRRAELLETIKKIELSRDNDTERRGSLFWLMQYQSLMEARPQGLLEGLEPMLVRHVAIAGALHCLPFLASLPSLLPNVDHDQLISIGINNADDRQAIILAVENYNAEKKLSSEETQLPTAPIDEPCSSSTNSQDRDISRVDMTECVVCFDSQCEIIFIPCGHLCCCAKCSNMVINECPMCRGSIQRKIQVHRP